MSRKVCILTPINGGKDLYDKILDLCTNLAKDDNDVKWTTYSVMSLEISDQLRLLSFVLQKELISTSILSYIDIVFLMDGWDAVPINKLIFRVANLLDIKIVYLQEKSSNTNAQDTISISGPISNVPNYRENFKRAQKHLKSLGYKNIINPAKIVKLIPDSISYYDALDIDLHFLSLCNKIYVLNNWEKSTGASTEVKYAEKHGIEIVFEDYKPIEV